MLQHGSPVPHCTASGLLWLQVSGAKRRPLHVPGYDKWDGISLEYKVDWPLHLLLTPEVSLSGFGGPVAKVGAHGAPSARQMGHRQASPVEQALHLLLTPCGATDALENPKLPV